MFNISTSILFVEYVDIIGCSVLSTKRFHPCCNCFIYLFCIRIKQTNYIFFLTSWENFQRRSFHCKPSVELLLLVIQILYILKMSYTAFPHLTVGCDISCWMIFYILFNMLCYIPWGGGFLNFVINDILCRWQTMSLRPPCWCVLKMLLWVTQSSSWHQRHFNIKQLI